MAIALVLALLPQVDFPTHNLLMSLLAGLLFSLVNTFVKPFVIILVGQPLIQTMGLLMGVINTVGFALLIRFSPFAWAIDSPQWVTCMTRPDDLGRARFVGSIKGEASTNRAYR